MACPCGSDNAFEECCGPYLRGDAQPPTAEALMRARYTAYATGEVDFVLRTQQVDTEEADREATAAWSRQSTWLGLDVVKVEAGGALDHDGTVEFVARYSHKDQEYAHHEEATFRKIDEQWRFIDGKMKNSTFRRTTPKLKPNQPCPCGSGKKWKKCCGQR